MVYLAETRRYVVVYFREDSWQHKQPITLDNVSSICSEQWWIHITHRKDKTAPSMVTIYPQDIIAQLDDISELVKDGDE